MVELLIEVPPATAGEGSSYNQSRREISAASKSERRAARSAKRLRRLSARLTHLPAVDVCVPLQALWQRVSLLVAAALLSAVMIFQVFDEHRVLILSSSYDTEALTAALRKSPDQPHVHSRLGLFYLYNPLELDAERALRHFQQAARLNPFDFNSWMNLGRAYEETGQWSRAERAYHQAIQLAPTYFLPHWLYANFLLRHGQTEQALTEFRRVADINPDAAENICELIWQLSANGADEVAKLGRGVRSQRARQFICQFLITRGSYAEALSVWSELSWDEPFTPLLTRRLVSGLMSIGEYDRAESVWRELVSHLDRRADAADQLFWNGDFEHEIDGAESPPTSDQRPTTYSSNGLDWTIESNNEVRASLVESEKYDGTRSLMLEFLKPERVTFSGVSHSLLLHPSTKYRLQFRYKTRKMLPESGLFVEIADAQSPQSVIGRWSLVTGEKPTTRGQGSRTPFSSNDQRQTTNDGESEWALASIEFETPPDLRAVIVRIVRKPRESYYDFVRGKIWFDAFTLEPLSVPR